MLCVIFFPILNLSIQGNEGKFHDAREENDLAHFVTSISMQNSIIYTDTKYSFLLCNHHQHFGSSFQ